MKKDKPGEVGLFSVELDDLSKFVENICSLDYIRNLL